MRKIIIAKITMNITVVNEFDLNLIFFDIN